MNYRTESFIERFKTALPHLSAKNIHSVVSFKYRENCANGSTYKALVDELGSQRTEMDIKPLSGHFNGRAWLAQSQEGGRAILVEHETGLEILGAIGSIASLIGIIPMVGWTWRKMREHFHSMWDGSIEIRRIDSNGNLIEESAPSVEAYVFKLASQRQEEMEKRIAELECEVAKLRTTHARKRTPRIKPKQNAK